MATAIVESVPTPPLYKRVIAAFKAIEDALNSDVDVPLRNHLKRLDDQILSLEKNVRDLEARVAGDQEIRQ